MKPTTTPTTVKKNVRHDFTADEIKMLNVDFGQAFDTLGAVESEFDNVKAVWKAKTTEAESRMKTLRATINAGFEHRLKDCIVIFRPADKKKDFYLADAKPTEDEMLPQPVLTEDMTPLDFEQDLIQAESGFENRVELELWNVGADIGILVVGKLKNKWFTAVRANVGAVRIEERLDSEQTSAKKRFDALQWASSRLAKWLKANLGKDAAKGFEEMIFTAVDGEKEKVE